MHGNISTKSKPEIKCTSATNGIKSRVKQQVWDKNDNDDDSEEYSFSPVMYSDRKVPINFTDLTKLGTNLDISKDVPIKKC